MRKTVETVVKEVEQVLESSLQDNNFDELADRIKKAERLFIAGEGRSGLVGKMIAMRLMHGGYEVYVTGETITPSIADGDLLMVLSGSGKTGSLVTMAETAGKTGAQIVSFTTDSNSPAAEKSDQVITIPAATKYRRAEEPKTIQPLGNQFDQSLHLLLDAFIVYMEGSNAENSNWKDRHANLE